MKLFEILARNLQRTVLIGRWSEFLFFVFFLFFPLVVVVVIKEILLEVNDATWQNKVHFMSNPEETSIC